MSAPPAKQPPSNGSPGQIPHQVNISDDSTALATAEAKTGTNGHSAAKKLVGGLASRILECISARVGS